jgi:predicted Zn-dependent protease
MTIHRLCQLLTLFITTLALAGCTVNPVTGKHELAIISHGQELAIGAEQYLPSQQSQGGIYTADPQLSAYVSEVGTRIAGVSDRDLPYEFVVINNSVPNAWALPGGKIAINRGLLTELGSEAELAAVLGHEVVHAAARHSANQIQRGMLLQGALIATAISTANSEYSNYIVGGAQLGAQILSQSYSRAAELESDYYGTLYMKRAGYNPQAAVSLQETFVRLSEGRQTNWLEGLFASHPPSRARVDANIKTVAELGAAGEINQHRFKEKLAHLRSKQDAYAAFDQANTLASQNEFASALARLDHAIETEPEEARFYGLKGDIRLAQENHLAATEEFSKALSIDDNYYEYYLGRGLARSKLGQTRAARDDLEHSNRLLPTAIANNTLGQMSLAAGDASTAKQYFGTAMNASGRVGDEARDAYTRLDLPDHPGRYIEARPVVAGSQLIAVVTNHSNIRVTTVSIEFIATVNGNRARRVVGIDAIEPAQQGHIASGWEFQAEDVVTEIGASVISARVN